MLDHFIPNVMSLFGFSKGQQTQQDMKNFDKLSDQQKKKYEKQFAAMKDNDVNTNNLGSWTQHDKRNNVVFNLVDGIGSYFSNFTSNLTDKTQAIKEKTVHFSKLTPNQLAQH